MSRPDENKNEHPVVHPIPPVYRADSRILILGSFPSVKSRETGFFLRPSAEPFLESDGSRVRGRGAADRGREEGVSAPESYRCLGCDRVLRHHRLERCEHPRCCAESAAGHSGMRRYSADLLQRGDRVEVLPEVPGEAAGTGSGSPSVDESRERRMVCGAAAWRVEPVRRSLTKRRVTG